jgi:hypothetical protein
MEPVKQIRDDAFKLEQLADAHIQSRKAHRFINHSTREEAQDLLRRFQQGYPSNPELKDFKMGTRFTWRKLKDLASKIFESL